MPINSYFLILFFYNDIQMFEFLYKAQEGINYDFIYYAYSFSVLICFILLILESFKIDAVQGYWIVSVFLLLKFRFLSK